MSQPPDNSRNDIQIRQTIDQMDGGTVIGEQHVYYIAQPDFHSSPLEKRNRERMLERVRVSWIEGVLENSLHEQVMLDLQMQEKPDAVENPWSLVLEQQGNREELPVGTPIIEVFDSLAGELLLLGEPGSGKTTLMLSLARDLIGRAVKDESHPMPVIFNLSTWANERKSIANWLVDELVARYQIPGKIGQTWLDNAQILPLLDGLDEVRVDHRRACAEAINTFQQEHGLMRTVVCCRSTEYQALNIKLKFQGAVVLQPLTFAQVEQYLVRLGENLNSVRTMIRGDQMLQELITSPLMLSILILAYQDMPAASLPALNSVEKWRNHLFNVYVQRMFKRKTNQQRYTPEQTRRWLTWLAQQMSQRAQTVFYIERLQPTWLQNRSEERRYILLAGLMLWIFTLIPLCIAFGLSAGAIIASIVSVAFMLTYGQYFGFFVGVGVGLSLSLPTRLVLGRPVQDYGIAATLAAALVLGVIFSIGALRFPILWIDRKRIRFIESLGWSWAKALQGLLVGAFIGIAGGVITTLGAGPEFGLANGIGMGTVLGIILASVFGLSGGEIDTRLFPNQGIWQSARNAVYFGAAIALVTGLVAGLVYNFILGGGRGLSNGIAFALGCGLFNIFFGGLTVIQHISLRWLLYRAGHMPLNYAHFLDDAAHKVLLRKVGGGYIFIHRLLLEYFAAGHDKI